jgi:hypothetical protein
MTVLHHQEGVRILDEARVHGATITEDGRDYLAQVDAPASCGGRHSP